MSEITQETRDELLLAVAEALLWLGDKDLLPIHQCNAEGAMHKARLKALLGLAEKERAD